MENTNEFLNNVTKVAADAAGVAVEAAKADFTTAASTVKEEMTAKLADNTTELQKSIDDLATKVESINISTAKAEAPTLKEELTSKEATQGLAALKNREINSYEIKLDPNGQVMKALSYGSGGEFGRVPGEARDLDIQTNPHYQTSVAANLMNSTTSNSDIVRYIREADEAGASTQANSAAGKAHSAAFAEKTIELSNFSENVVTIGEFVTLNEEQLSDVAGLRSFVTQEFMGDLMDLVDRYILTGNGTNQLNGFSQTGQHTAWAAQDQFASGTTNVNNIDVLINAIAQLEGTNYMCDTIFMNPADFWGVNFALAKASTHEYVARQILQAASTGVMPMVGGAKIVRSNAVTSDAFYALDAKKAAKLWTAEGSSIEFARNGDDFKNNQISGRIKCRKALTVGRPSGILLGDFSAARTALVA